MPNMLIGIDIGSRFTKVVELELKGKPVLLNAFLFPTPTEALPNGLLYIKGDSFLQEITKFIPEKNLRVARISVNLPPPSITATSIFLPVINKKELLFAAVNEAKHKMIPVSGIHHVFECLMLGEQIVAKSKKSEVLVVRTEKVYIQKIIDVFASFDIAPVSITPAGCVLSNLLPKEAKEKDESVICMDIGATSINISVVRNSKLVFLRNVIFGFNDIIVDVARQLGVAREVAERAIQEQGIPQIPFDLKDKVAIAEEIMRQKYEEGQELSADGPRVNALELRMLWQPHLERIMHELRRSLVFYKEQSEGKRVDQIYFLGGVSQIKHFLASIAPQVGGKCHLIMPFADVQIVKEKTNENEVVNSPIFVNAASLALGSIKTKAAEETVINFLPLEIKKKEIVARRRLILLVLSFVVISLFSLAALKVTLDNALIRKDIKSKEFELKRFKKLGKRLSELQAKEQFVGKKDAAVKLLAAGKDALRAALQELPKAVPEEIVLTKLTLEAGIVTIKAEVSSDYEQALEIVEAFRHKLESTKYFRDVSITPLKLERFTAQMAGSSGDIVLTSVKVRKFTVTASVGGK
ncbi:MAG: pilus assembly protein PilM [Candidatus Omnitrophota bacterium]